MEPQQTEPQQQLCVQFMARCQDLKSKSFISIHMAASCIGNQFVLNRNVKGFSVLELLFAMSLVLVLFRFSMPPIQVVLQGYLFAQEVNQIAEDIRETRLHAVSNTLWCRMEFVTSVPIYSIYYGTQLQKTRSFQKSLHYLGNWLSYPSYRISFDGTGGPSEAGTFRFADDYGNQASIIVYLGSGLVRVREWHS